MDEAHAVLPAGTELGPYVIESRLGATSPVPAARRRRRVSRKPRRAARARGPEHADGAMWFG